MRPLNPEAAEFFPNLFAELESQDGYTLVTNGIRSSNKLPNTKGTDAVSKNIQEIYRCLTKGLLQTSNIILKMAETNISLTGCKGEHYIDKVIEANDSILDFLNLEIGSLNFLPETTKVSGTANSKPSTSKIASWNERPVIRISKIRNVSLLTADNIRRPQLRFKDVDNSNKWFTPRIYCKYNALKPLEYSILYNSMNEPIGYENPYTFEINAYQPTMAFVMGNFGMDLPQPVTEFGFSYINTLQQLQDLIHFLKRVPEIAIDLEHHAYRSYLGFTCLMQITAEAHDFIIDTLVIREHMYLLNEIFTNPNQVKILHGAVNDILWLQKDFSLYIVGMFDTFHAAQILNFPYLSLKYLLKRYCDIDADKTYQSADWRIRPLPIELIKYARTDTHFLLYIWRQLKNELLALGNGSTVYLEEAFRRSKETCLASYVKEVVTEDSHLKLLANTLMKFDNRQTRCLKELYKWRDSIAREEDESTSYVLANQCLLKLAEKLPKEPESILACCEGIVPPILNRNINVVQKIIKTCRELSVDITIPCTPEKSASTSKNLFTDKMHNWDFREGTPTLQVKDYMLSKNVEIKTPLACQKLSSEAMVDLDRLDDKKFTPPAQRHIKFRLLQASDLDGDNFPSPGNRKRAVESDSSKEMKPELSGRARFLAAIEKRCKSDDACKAHDSL